MINGEIVPIIEAIDYQSKDELLQKLRNMRDDTVRLAPEDRRVVKQMLGVAIQEVCYTSEYELLRYKRYINYKANKKRKVRKWTTKLLRLSKSPIKSPKR